MWTKSYSRAPSLPQAYLVVAAKLWVAILNSLQDPKSSICLLQPMLSHFVRRGIADTASIIERTPLKEERKRWKPFKMKGFETVHLHSLSRPLKWRPGGLCRLQCPYLLPQQVAEKHNEQKEAVEGSKEEFCGQEFLHLTTLPIYAFLPVLSSWLRKLGFQPVNHCFSQDVFFLEEGRSGGKPNQKLTQNKGHWTALLTEQLTVHSKKPEQSTKSTTISFCVIISMVTLTRSAKSWPVEGGAGSIGLKL